ncbi:SDR family NAD(P)-dependent oxidoreductase [Curtobacterium aurantiacum]|uniref:SDR family NAD(P)-dependent oxidoreductase n=1 Tax=Curtobacterium aurantiacum TaxID=3236919 RepID=UPI001BDEAC4F|nr:SDR family oxidoreductase [Curtobacterium flaccumfaciens]MBT1679006.1 SDR family oxidoreductase [Curtobacterium flaccumfaciens pv. flaccumfaciens]
MQADPTTTPNNQPSAATTAPRRHAGKVALVTGGARGIGAGIVRRLAEEGAHVVFTYASAATNANALVSEIETAGGSASAIAADSSSRDQVRHTVETVLERHGRLDIVVSNAGGGTTKLVDALTDDEIDQMVDVNIRGTLDLIRFSTPYMVAGGRIITIGSVLAHFVPGEGSSVYAMTKGAVASLVQGLSRELGPRGITINNVQPGPVHTDGNPEDGPVGQTLRDLIPIGRFGAVEEIASFVSYVASDESAYLNGANLDVDGGFSA